LGAQLFLLAFTTDGGVRAPFVYIGELRCKKPAITRIEEGLMGSVLQREVRTAKKDWSGSCIWKY